MAENVTLSAKQKQAIAALMAGGSVRRAAKICKISERQLYRWLSENAFKAELDRAGAETIQATVRMLTDASGGAVLTLREIFTSKAASTSSRVRAADVVLGHLMRIKELAELEQRLIAVERVLKLRETR